jgi:hypothetical protein
MDPLNKGSVAFGALLVTAGVLFLVLAFVPGLSISQTWPLVFYFAAAAFAIPAFLWPRSRRGLSALFIPGAILLVLGLIFTYNVLTEDWVSWAYAWLLIPAGVGGGLLLATSLGGWGTPVRWVAIWLMGGAVALFGLFASLFGSPAMRIAGAALVIGLGALFLYCGLPKTGGIK